MQIPVFIICFISLFSPYAIVNNINLEVFAGFFNNNIYFTILNLMNTSLNALSGILQHALLVRVRSKIARLAPA